MKLDDIYTSNSNFLKAEDLQGKKPIVTIASADVVEKDYGDGQGPKKQVVLAFNGTEKVLGLNRTNANRLAELIGSDDSDDWVGASIKLFVEQVTFQNKVVPAIRIFPELPNQNGQPVQDSFASAMPTHSGNAEPPNFPNGTPDEDISIPF